MISGRFSSCCYPPRIHLDQTGSDRATNLSIRGLFSPLRSSTTDVFDLLYCWTMGEGLIKSQTIKGETCFDPSLRNRLLKVALFQWLHCFRLLAVTFLWWLFPAVATRWCCSCRIFFQLPSVSVCEPSSAFHWICYELKKLRIKDDVLQGAPPSTLLSSIRSSICQQR